MKSLCDCPFANASRCFFSEYPRPSHRFRDGVTWAILAAKERIGFLVIESFLSRVKADLPVANAMGNAGHMQHADAGMEDRDVRIRFLPRLH